ncbi:MAG: membrane protease subunit HflC [Alphaproteobacteria bacterium]|jgi:membrane protease subunit HflC
MSKLKILGVVAFLGLVTAQQTLFTVQETEQALIERFGQLRENIPNAGIFAKLPFVDNVIYIEKRVLNLQTAEIQAILEDKKQLVVDAFARYKITDPIKFYQAAGNIFIAEDKIATILDSATRGVFGKETLREILSSKRSGMMDKIRKLSSKQTQDFGIEVIDVRILRAELPPENSASIFKRMSAERRQQADQFRAEGREKALEITSRADRESEVIKAEARRDSEIIRGEGDSDKNRIYAESYGRDKNFFEFYRSMIAYERAFNDDKGGSTTMVLSTKDNFLKEFKNN